MAFLSHLCFVFSSGETWKRPDSRQLIGGPEWAQRLTLAVPPQLFLACLHGELAKVNAFAEDFAFRLLQRSELYKKPYGWLTGGPTPPPPYFPGRRFSGQIFYLTPSVPQEFFLAQRCGVRSTPPSPRWVSNPPPPARPFRHCPGGSGRRCRSFPARQACASGSNCVPGQPAPSVPHVAQTFGFWRFFARRRLWRSRAVCCANGFPNDVPAFD